MQDVDFRHSVNGELIRSETIAPDLITFADFSGSNYAGIDYFNTNTNIVGKGIDKTIYQMIPHSSTRASYVSGLAPAATNQCTLIRAAGRDGNHTTNGQEFANFTLAGTDQGHIYNGLEIGYSNGVNIHDIKITGVPGDDIAPPGETFPLSLWHVNNAEITKLYIDGEGIAATLVGNNNVSDCIFTDCTFTGSGSAMPGASWQSKNIVFDNCSFLDCPRGYNIENPYGGYHTFKNCAFDQFPEGWQITPVCGIWVAANSNCASTILTIEDPVWDFAKNGPFKVLHYPLSLKPQNLQLDSDIHLVLDGIDVSNDPTKLKLVTINDL